MRDGLSHVIYLQLVQKLHYLNLIMSYKLQFYKNSTGQISKLLFLVNPSEHSWQSSPSNHLSIFKLCDIQTVPLVAFVHDVDKDSGTLANHEPQTR